MLIGLHLANQRLSGQDYETIRLMRACAAKLWSQVHNPADASALLLAFPGLQLVVRTTDLPLPFPNFVNTMVDRWFQEIGSFYHAGVRYFQCDNEPNTNPRVNPWSYQYYMRGIAQGLRARLDSANMADAVLVSPPLSWSPGLWRRGPGVPFSLDDWLAAYAYTDAGNVSSLPNCFGAVGANCYFQSERQMADPSFGLSFERLQDMSGGKEAVLCEWGLSPSEGQTPAQLEALRLELYPQYVKGLQQYDIHSAHLYISAGATHDWASFFVTPEQAKALGRCG